MAAARPVDPRVKYQDPSAITRERERQQMLEDRGYRFVRWLGKEIYLQPDLVIARIARALG